MRACRLSLPWCETTLSLKVPPNTDREGLLALLQDQLLDAEVFVFVDNKILLPHQRVPLGEIHILPVLSGG